MERTTEATTPQHSWVCETCGSKDISITPVPGLWLQYWCNACDHWWWETADGKRAAAQKPA